MIKAVFKLFAVCILEVNLVEDLLEIWREIVHNVSIDLLNGEQNGEQQNNLSHFVGTARDFGVRVETKSSGARKRAISMLPLTTVEIVCAENEQETLAFKCLDKVSLLSAENAASLVTLCTPKVPFKRVRFGCGFH